MKKNNKINLNSIFILFSFFALFISIFTNHYHYDEALVNDALIGYSKIKSFVMINNHDLESPFNKFFSYLIYTLNPDPSKIENYFYNRIVGLIFVLLGFIYLIKIQNKFFIKEKKFFYISYGLYVYWFSFHSGGVTSRFDALLASLIIIYIYYYLISCNFHKNTGFYLTYLLNFILLTCHPFFLYPLFISAIYILKINWNNKYIFVLLTIFGSIFFFPLLMFDKINAKNLYQYILNLIFFTGSHLNHNYDAPVDYLFIIKNILKDMNVFGSTGRFVHLRYYALTSYIIVLFLVTINIFFSVIKISKNNKLINLIGIYFLFCLAISPSKWAHHLSIIVIIYCILVPTWLIFFVKLFYNNIALNKYFVLLKKININLLFIIFMYLIISFNFFKFSKDNYNLYSLIKEKFPSAIKLKFFDDMKDIDENLSKLRPILKDKTYFGDPHLIHLFPESKYIGYSADFLNNKEAYFFITQSNKIDTMQKKNYNIIPKFRGTEYHKLIYSFAYSGFFYHIYIK
jgi:hypothetical protein